MCFQIQILSSYRAYASSPSVQSGVQLDGRSRALAEGPGGLAAVERAVERLFYYQVSGWKFRYCWLEIGFLPVHGLGAGCCEHGLGGGGGHEGHGGGHFPGHRHGGVHVDYWLGFWGLFRDWLYYWEWWGVTCMQPYSVTQGSVKGWWEVIYMQLGKVYWGLRGLALEVGGGQQGWGILFGSF